MCGVLGHWIMCYRAIHNFIINLYPSNLLNSLIPTRFIINFSVDSLGVSYKQACHLQIEIVLPFLPIFMFFCFVFCFFFINFDVFSCLFSSQDLQPIFIKSHESRHSCLANNIREKLQFCAIKYKY